MICRKAGIEKGIPVTDTATINGYLVVFDQGETNWGAVVEDIPGLCFTVAGTREECERRITEAIAAHLQALELRRRGKLEPRGTGRKRRSA